jgi:uncharacterized protein (DUF433 family)
MSEEERVSSELSVRELAALAGVSERVLRNEVDRGIVGPRKRAGRRLELPGDALLYLLLVRETPIVLSRADRSALYRLVTGDKTGAGSWRETAGGVKRGNVTISTKELRRQASKRLRIYRRGLSRLASDPGILGGEPVFSGTRLAVRHVGRLAARMAAAELRTEFPQLSHDDIAFAHLFARMKPGPGRPRKRLRFRAASA